MHYLYINVTYEYEKDQQLFKDSSHSYIMLEYKIRASKDVLDTIDIYYEKKLKQSIRYKMKIFVSKILKNIVYIFK